MIDRPFAIGPSSFLPRFCTTIVAVSGFRTLIASITRYCGIFCAQDLCFQYFADFRHRSIIRNPNEARNLADRSVNFFDLDSAPRTGKSSLPKCHLPNAPLPAILARSGPRELPRPRYFAGIKSNFPDDSS